MPPKRAAASPPAAATAAEAKKYKSAMDSMADEWVCPITAELPIDPVMAEDGKVYERAAIEEHIRVNRDSLRSPITNEAMGKRLIASSQARNTIEKLVRSGAITGDKAERWLERLSDEELVKTTTRRAEGGDANAMHDLSWWYADGAHGLAEDATASHRWAKKGADAGDASCMAFAGEGLVLGVGADKNATLGAVLTTKAAMLGSAFAACCLGSWFYHGLHGLPKDRAEAKYWYGKVATASEKDANDDEVEIAAQRAAGE